LLPGLRPHDPRFFTSITISSQLTTTQFPLPSFNNAEPAGGNVFEVDVNLQYTGYEFHYAYLAFCAFIVFLIIPGLGFLYGGLSRRKSSLAMLFQSLAVLAVTTIQWMFWGYSLAYSRTAGPFIGDLANFGLKNVMAAPSASVVIPEIVFCLYQLMFW
jgi:Amt family ammonium transporter